MLKIEITDKTINLENMIDVQVGPIVLVDGGLGYDGKGESLNYFFRDIKDTLRYNPEKLVVYLDKQRYGHYKATIYIPLDDFGNPYRSRKI